MSGSRLVGTAGWSIPSHHAPDFPGTGSHLQRYATRFDAVEINSSFYRPHRRTTYERWAASVPADFRFSVKLPREITHRLRLADCAALLDLFADQVTGLAAKLAVLLVQLPPSFAFNPGIVANFFSELRLRASAKLACEPRHASWFSNDADRLLARLGVARVAADPALLPVAGTPGGWQGLRYFRLHGSPVIYRSAYEEARLRAYADAIAAITDADTAIWCIFDNTARMAATGDGLLLRQMLADGK